MLAALGNNLTSASGTTGWISAPTDPPDSRFDKWLRTAGTTNPGEYCTQYRLSTVVVDELIRAEVRVMWWKSRAARDSGWKTCPTGMLTGGNPDRQAVQSVAVSSMLWKHGFY